LFFCHPFSFLSLSLFLFFLLILIFSNLIFFSIKELIVIDDFSLFPRFFLLLS